MIPIRFASLQTPIGIGDGGAMRISIYSVGKKCTDEAPYCVANEWICGEIGRHLRLPLPPFCTIYQGKQKECWFVSLDAGSNGETLPPASFERCASELPEFSTGMMLFDILIMNPDRHDENFAVDYQADPPRPILFDHGHALFGHQKSGGVARLHANMDGLGMDGGSHSVMQWLRTDEYFNEWLERINSMPDVFIREICRETRDAGILKDEADEAAKAVMHRRDNLLPIIKRHQNRMSRLERTLYGPLGGSVNDSGTEVER